MILQLDSDEMLIGRSHLILKHGNYIKKYYPRSHIDTDNGFNSQVEKDTWWLNHVKESTKFMKLVHPDLYVSEEQDDNFYCVTQNFIDNNDARGYGYRHNIRCYLNIINTLGYDYAKRDMQWYNLLYRKQDDKPFCIDWDAYQVLQSEEEAYHYYKSELTSDKWFEQYPMSYHYATEIFNKEWNRV